MEVSIIIVNYKTCDITLECINSIKSNTFDIIYEIIVIDNASKDESKDRLSQIDGITFIESKTNLGFGKANNLGYQYAKGKYIFCLNSDTILLNNAIKIFHDKIKLLPKNVACIGTRLRAPDMNYNHSYGKFPSILTTLQSSIGLYLKLVGIKIQFFDERKFDNVDNFEVEFVMGADMFIKREIIEKMGFFDPEFFMYFEETEMQLRFHKNGYKNMIITGPEIIHLESASTKVEGKKHNFQQQYLYFTSFFLYLRKRYNYLNYLIARLSFMPQAPIFFSNCYSFKEKIKLLSLMFDLRR